MSLLPVFCARLCSVSPLRAAVQELPAWPFSQLPNQHPLPQELKSYADSLFQGIFAHRFRWVGLGGGCSLPARHDAAPVARSSLWGRHLPRHVLPCPIPPLCPSHTLPFPSSLACRCRDCSEEIRATAIEGIGGWVRLHPAAFLTDQVGGRQAGSVIGGAPGVGVASGCVARAQPCGPSNVSPARPVQAGPLSGICPCLCAFSPLPDFPNCFLSDLVRAVPQVHRLGAVRQGAGLLGCCCMRRCCCWRSHPWPTRTGPAGLCSLPCSGVLGRACQAAGPAAAHRRAALRNPRRSRACGWRQPMRCWRCTATPTTRRPCRRGGLGLGTRGPPWGSGARGAGRAVHTAPGHIDLCVLLTATHARRPLGCACARRTSPRASPRASTSCFMTLTRRWQSRG